ncbi:hypothetical protein JTB14_006488 [Gonioctena quinquepunctata]|nr:hypothetical protein JTB14_006488 [Gonioctena quinquepunctata]
MRSNTSSDPRMEKPDQSLRKRIIADECSFHTLGIVEISAENPSDIMDHNDDITEKLSELQPESSKIFLNNLRHIRNHFYGNRRSLRMGREKKSKESQSMDVTNSPPDLGKNLGDEYFEHLPMSESEQKQKQS